MLSITDTFFFLLLVAGVGGTLYHLVEAHWWRISNWRAHREADRLIRRMERSR